MSSRSRKAGLNSMRNRYSRLEEKLQAANREVDRLLRESHQTRWDAMKQCEEVRQAADMAIAAMVLNLNGGDAATAYRLPRRCLKQAADYATFVTPQGDDVIVELRERLPAAPQSEKPEGGEEGSGNGSTD